MTIMRVYAEGVLKRAQLDPNVQQAFYTWNEAFTQFSNVLRSGGDPDNRFGPSFMPKRRTYQTN